MTTNDIKQKMMNKEEEEKKTSGNIRFKCERGLITPRTDGSTQDTFTKATW